MTVRRRLASQGGFGVVELLIAMTVMVVAIMALVAVLNSGMVTLRRAADASTAAAVADKQMEAYRALPNCAIHLDAATLREALRISQIPPRAVHRARRTLRCSGRPACHIGGNTAT